MNVEGLTPHGPGFRFVDRFERTGPASGSGWKHLTGSESFFADHFPGEPLMPGVLLVECAAQAAGILWMEDKGTPTAPLFLASVDQFRIISSVLPGETVEARVTMGREFGSLAQVEAECLVGERIVAKGRLILSRQAGSAPSAQRT
jgi:3-hydroxymyristoyl/3-hydroxydecanoyl-(acyl carrier protein) dehydratase